MASLGSAARLTPLQSLEFTAVTATGGSSGQRNIQLAAGAGP